MKLGFGLYSHMLNEEHYKFAKQCGATHIVVHLVDYFNNTDNSKDHANQPIGSTKGWGVAGDGILWSLEFLLELKKEINSHGLELEAIENFDPAMWHDILLDGPKKEAQIELVKKQIRIVGKARIPVFGYNFSLAGVTGRIIGNYARGGAASVGMEGSADETPIPNGMVWNMVYDSNATEGFLPKISHDELWDRLHYFLEHIIPVAEEAGVKMAAHPDDPPVPYLRETPRLVYQPAMYQRLIDMKPSPSNTLEFCLGSIAEMTEGNVYQATETYSKQGKIGYVHFRNVIGKVPNYKEVFVDEGDIDLVRVLRILKKSDYEGVLIPDHTPQMSCDGAWYAGMSYAMGFMKAAITIVNNE
ncbi:mannonate dehydratase [Zobellia galactanivorans]|uniref:mannonate dehydratase n=1 Tax=Zobellia galactanivorans (strain DSM 12802 / CCUG 47099 / CIP 106680 / NCIMB 13871 / Dsij) TaxID=63186 RepID=UPI0026E2AB48|nr:mannonate dehydratase [Zobellia galactanivorans]MDO6809956.1 mannonate dehydratase [Zobellia galactanivorans]